MADNAASRLKKEGLDISKTDVLTASVHDIHFPPRVGHPLSTVWHPRSELTIADPGIKRLVDEIVERGEITEAALVREDWIKTDDGGKRKVFTCVDGAGRTIAGRYAEEIMHKAGRLHRLGVPAALRIKIRLFVGSDKDLLLARQRADSDPSKRPHPPSVLAIMTGQMLAEKATMPEILAVMPREVREVDVIAMQRWGNLCPEAQARFDAGAPLGLLRAVLDVPREEQIATLDKLITAGATQMKGATRVINREAKIAEQMKSTEKVLADSAAKSNSLHALGMSTLPNSSAEPATVAPIQRPHPKAMAKMLRAVEPEGLGDNESPEDFEGPEAYLAGQADGLVYGLRIALGEISHTSLPTKLANLLAKALADEAKATKPAKAKGKKRSAK